MSFDNSSNSRRQFLKHAGVAALGVPFLLKGSAYARPARSCVVIGAGLSGLAAAYALTRANWKVTVLEARERAGGRVLSHSFDENAELVCELGAEWVGASHERMQGLCREFDIRLQEHRFEFALMRNGVVAQEGAWNFSPQATAAFERFKKEFKAYTPQQQKRLDAYDWWTCLQNIGFTDDDLRLRDLMDSTDFGESIRHVSAYAAASEYFESSPANEMDFKMVGGNSRLVRELATRIRKGGAGGVAGVIRFNMPVTKIRQRAGRVRVTAKGEQFDADACICTVPARLLTRIRFDPPLPSAQLRAAERLQYSRIIKSSILYNERFWGADDASLVSDVTSHFYFHSTQRQPATQGIFTSYAIGEKADVLAAQDDRRRMEIISRDLLPYSARAVETHRAIASYAWQRDPHTRGAYALYRPGQWFTVRPLLQQPHGKVLFAGEHLADWQGFMEGAVVTGEEAARELTGRNRRPLRRTA